jgi:hypothetical protein
MDADPTPIAFKWICRCYVGFLSIEQVLVLWDRILGFAGGKVCGPDQGEGLQLLSVLAMVIFQYKKQVLLNAKTKQDVVVIKTGRNALYVGKFTNLSNLGGPV